MPKLFSSRSFLVFAALAITAIAVACGGSDSDEPASTATSRPATATPTTAAAEPTSPSAGPAGDAARGAELFVSETCSGCHSTGDNAIVGPGLAGIGERAAALGGDAYLIESLNDPLAVVVDGFAPIMSNFSHLDDQTIADLVAYLNTLN